MNLVEQIDQDLTDAQKAQDEKVVGTLRMLKSALTNFRIAAKKEQLEDADALGVLQKEIKTRQDAIGLYKQGGREELAAKEEGEIEILKKYLPEQMSEEEVKTAVDTAIAETGATEIKDMGKVMGKLMGELKGKADPTLVSQLVKEKLAK